MFFGILQPYIIDIYRFYFEEHMPGYLPLEKEHLQSVVAAVEMGKKRRTVEVISLPIGQLAN